MALSIEMQYVCVDFTISFHSRFFADEKLTGELMKGSNIFQGKKYDNLFKFASVVDRFQKFGSV